MLSFFTILLILVGANAVFIVFSLAGISGGSKKSGKPMAKSPFSALNTFLSWTSKSKKAA